MREFDDYVKGIIGDLWVSKKKKAEMFDEYRDHLTLLKQEYIKNGLSEVTAREEAIKSFGSRENLKVYFNNAFSYRTATNTFIGVIITLLIFIVGSRIPLPGLFISNGSFSFNFTYIFWTLSFASMFIPVGYFLPIIFKRRWKVKNTILASLLLSVIWGISTSINLGSIQGVTSIKLISVQASFIGTCFLGELVGIMLGFALLKLISKAAQKFRYS